MTSVTSPPSPPSPASPARPHPSTELARLSERRVARVGGVLYLLTHVTSVAAVALYGGSAFDPHAPLASRDAVLAGGVLEVVLALAVVGTAVAWWPLLRTRAPLTASGYLALRTLEAGVILTGVVALLPVVARPGAQSATGLDPEVGAALHLVHDWTFLVGPGLVVPVHTLLLAVVLLRRRLVPRFVPWLGIVGAPLVAGMNLAVLAGATTVVPALVIPTFAWEVTLAVTLIARGLAAPGGSRPGV